MNGRFWRLHVSMLGFAVCFVTGCSGSKNANEATASPAAIVSATETATASPEAPASTAATESTVATPATGVATAEASPGASVDANPASPEPSATEAAPTPTPTATQDPNLLDAVNGTILRSYPLGLDTDPEAVSRGVSFDDSAKGPFVFVFELPGVAAISSFVMHLRGLAEGQTANITIAVSTTSATDGFRDVGAEPAATSGDKTLAENVSARWVRVTLDAGAKTAFGGLDALGTLQPRPATAPSPSGVFVEANPYKPKDGAFVPDPGATTDPWYVRFTSVAEGANAPAALSGVRCYDGRLGDPYPGSFDGRVWTWQNSQGHGRFVVNDEATIISNDETYYVRNSRMPKFCQKLDAGGKGATKVLVLDKSDYTLYPVGDNPTPFPAYHFDRESAAMVDPADLSKYSIAELNGLCDAGDYFSPPIARALADWVAAGHKLMIYDADMCGSRTAYAFLPYPFTTNNPGASGARGDRLIEVENDQLGTLDPTDKAHYFDPKPFATGSNQLGDANTVTSHDSHWCGHLFGTNKNHVNGFMQMYAPYGKGLIIYGGLDHDDDGNAYFQRIRTLELAASVDGNDPCTETVSLAFLIEPSQNARFTPGKSVTLHFPMELLANQGWKGHATLTTSGDFPGSVTPGGKDVNGGTVPLSVAVRIPASAKPGQYAVLVTGTGSDGQTAQATIAFQASTPIVKQLKMQRRIRLYGIHFDVDSARIQPRSEPVIKEVAQIMREEPSWRFRIEGHTDSDGGIDHNRVLSQHRAESVVNDLIKRYHIAKSRLVPVGYGLTRPVATNATTAGKALNRRVELVRL
jgi:outer membrane protein OmpA-like peptidoglycan-associated protein